jgi:hypothetical protein
LPLRSSFIPAKYQKAYNDPSQGSNRDDASNFETNGIEHKTHGMFSGAQRHASKQVIRRQKVFLPSIYKHLPSGIIDFAYDKEAGGLQINIYGYLITRV